MGSGGKKVVEAAAVVATGGLAYIAHEMDRQKDRAKQTMKDAKNAQVIQDRKFKEQQYKMTALKERQQFRARQKTMGANAQGRASTILGGSTDMATGGSAAPGGKTLLGV